MHQPPDQPPHMKQWQGRIDEVDGALAWRWHQIVRPFDAGAAAGKGIALLGFACDAGVARNHGRTGARGGPAALRSVLGNMPVHRCTCIADAGDVVCTAQDSGDSLEQAQEELAQQVARVLATGMTPLAMGGGHEIAYASFSGLARHLAKSERVPRIGIINLDAHFDLRMAERASSGTPFRQIAEDCATRGWPFHYLCLGISNYANTEALFERARQLGVRWLLDEEMSSTQLHTALATVAGFLQEVDHVYFTICLDVLPASVAPGVSAPAARGVPLDVIEPVVDAIAQSGKLRVADMAELNPIHDIDQRTARVGARLLARVAEGLSCCKSCEP